MEGPGDGVIVNGLYIAVLLLARLGADGFASLWCFYTAIAYGGTLLHMRYAKPHKATPDAVS
jgi:hypothetical protein